MSFWNQRRIPITKGWGPCKKTHWVPVNERGWYHGANGMTQGYDWSVGIDPGPFAHPPGRPPVPIGFMEFGRGPPRAVIRDDRWNDNRGLHELLDEMMAGRMQDEEDRRHIRAYRANQFQARNQNLQDEINVCNNRVNVHVDEFIQNTNRPISDARLDELREEAEFWRTRGQQRAEDQARRDRRLEREMRDARYGRRMREEMAEHGFVPVIGTSGSRW